MAVAMAGDGSAGERRPEIDPRLQSVGVPFPTQHSKGSSDRGTNKIASRGGIPIGGGGSGLATGGEERFGRPGRKTKIRKEKAASFGVVDDGRAKIP